MQLSEDDLEMITQALLCYYRHMHRSAEQQRQLANLFERVQDEREKVAA